MGKTRSLIRPVVALLAMAAFAPSGWGALIEYLDRTQWESTVVVGQTITFNNVTPQPPPNGGVARSGSSQTYTEGNTKFTGFSPSFNYIWYVRSPQAGGEYDFGSGVLAHTGASSSSGPARFRIEFAAPVTAVGLSLMTHGPDGGMVYLTINNGPEISVQTNLRPFAKFWGVTSDTPISTLDVYSKTAGTETLIDNVSSGALQETPEATTLAMAAGGLVAMGLWRRKHLKSI